MMHEKSAHFAAFLQAIEGRCASVEIKRLRQIAYLPVFACIASGKASYSFSVTHGFQRIARGVGHTAGADHSLFLLRWLMFNKLAAEFWGSFWLVFGGGISPAEHRLSG
ncbi:hypothetical protein O0544_16530 [Edwardsiella anguillarum]|nr:hypothetical protein [Edwardsiella anguillarum]